MNAKTLLMLGLKTIILTLILFVCYWMASMAVGLQNASQFANSTNVAVSLLIVCALQSISLSYPIIRSRWTGYRLVLTMFLVFYGIATFLPQIESIVFLRYLADIIPAKIVPRLFLQGVIVAGLFSPLAVFVHGKMKRGEQPHIAQQPFMPRKGWIWRMGLIMGVYVAIYFSFGMFVFKPLAGKAYQEYYGDLQLPIWIIPFQMVRAMVWAALALPIIWMMDRWWEAGLAVSLLFSLLMASLLLLPNPYMPDTIRMAHFVEVSSSNFLFGWIVVWLLGYRYSSKIIVKIK